MTLFSFKVIEPFDILCCFCCCFWDVNRFPSVVCELEKLINSSLKFNEERKWSFYVNKKIKLRGGVGSSPRIKEFLKLNFKDLFFIFLTKISTNLENFSVSDSSELSPFAVVNFQLTTPYFYLTEMQKKLSGLLEDFLSLI